MGNVTCPFSKFLYCCGVIMHGCGWYVRTYVRTVGVFMGVVKILAINRRPTLFDTSTSFVVRRVCTNFSVGGAVRQAMKPPGLDPS